MMIPRFHLAFPVRDLAEARAFYGDLLGFPEIGGSRPHTAIFYVNDRPLVSIFR